MTGTAAILAGGTSSRFGSLKALHMINGRPMITVVGDRLSTLFSRVLVAGWPPGHAAPSKVLPLSDMHAGKGALGGIHTALTNTTDDWVFCCSCDMPLIRPEVVQRIIASIADEDILVPVIGGIRQPLHAVYRRRILSLVDRLCLSADMYLPDLLKAAQVRCLEETAFAEIPDYALSFVSLNDRAQLHAYARYLSTV